MPTVRDICERSLRRIRVASSVDPVSAEDASIAREVLNSMIASWPSQGVQPFYSDLALNDAFVFFVPPADASGEAIGRATYRGAWDASANSPPLSSSIGSIGDVYRVSTAGSTILDDVSSWAENDYAMFDGSDWLKADSSARFERAVIDLLAFELCNEFGKEPMATLALSVRRAWITIQAAFIKPPAAGFDRALIWTFTPGGVGSVCAGDQANSADDSGGGSGGGDDLTGILLWTDEMPVQWTDETVVEW